MRSDPAVDRKKLSPLGKEIVEGLEEVLEHVRGKIKLRTRAVEVPSRVDLKALRKKCRLSQAEFARRYGFSRRTLQEWEQGRANPDGAVRAYLTVIAKNPTAVNEALGVSR